MSEEVVDLRNIYKLSDDEFDYLVDRIYDETRIKMGGHKRALVSARLGRRIRLLRLTSFADYIQYLDGPEGTIELVNFVNAVTTNKTDFFRENKQFEYMTNVILPEVKERMQRGIETKLRIWSAGCSTGEEPYTILMTLFEFFGHTAMRNMDVMMLASDIDTNVLERAEEGVYKEEVVRPVPPDLLHKYFMRGSGVKNQFYKVKDYLKEYVKFRQINLKQEQFPIRTSFDILFCRNVIIYFDKEFQRGLFKKFSPFVKETGYVFIGHSETLFGVSTDFKYVANNIYRKVVSNE